MVTDDDRRRVAEMLRGVEILTDIAGWKWMKGNLFGLSIMAKTEDTVRSGLNSLADLIDPDCEEGRYSVARTVRPVDREARGVSTARVDLTEVIDSARGVKCWECSSCGRSFESLFGDYEYCPRCGARLVMPHEG